MSQSSNDETQTTVTTQVRFERGGVPAAGGTVPLLVRIEGTAPSEGRVRTPLDVALVVDRSGSMGGAPIEAAIQAAHIAVDVLEDGDRLALVLFDSRVEVLLPATDVRNRDAIHAVIDRIRVRGLTALHAGWVEGTQQLVHLLSPDRAARVVLLTDGQANRGLTDAGSIAADVARMAQAGITTSAVGLGAHFDEDLLTAIAESGRGRFAYAESPEMLEGIMANEFMSIDATLARNVSITPHLGPVVTGLRFANGTASQGDAMQLPDLIAKMPVDVVAEVDVAPIGDMDAVDLGTLTLTYTDASGSVRTLDTLVQAPVLDAAAYAATTVDVEVAVAVAVQRSARMRQEAMDAMAARDHARAKEILEAVRAMLTQAPTDPRITRQLASVADTLDGLERRDYARSRKRMSSDAYAARSSFSEMSLESEFYKDKRSAMEARSRQRMAAATAPTAPTALHRYTVRRVDGSVAEIHLVDGDVTTVAADVLINPSNPSLRADGRSVDAAVQRAGGRMMFAERAALAPIAWGQAVVTAGHGLPVAHVVHVAVPAWDGQPQSLDLLGVCHANALDEVSRLQADHVTLVSMGTGSNGFPLEDAAKVGVAQVLQHVSRVGAPSRVTWVVQGSASALTVDAALRAGGAVVG